MLVEPWRQELVEALGLLQQHRLSEIDVCRMLELAEWCFGEGELLYCLVYLKVARLTQCTRLQCSARGSSTCNGDPAGSI